MNKWDVYPELKRVQHSVFYYSDLQAKDDPIIKRRPSYHFFFYPRMLGEDLTHGVLPSLSLNRNWYSVQVEPKNTELEKILAFAISKRDYYERRLADAAYWFFERVVSTLAYYGKSYFEIVEIIDPKSEKVKAFDLSPIQPMSLFFRKDHWVQYIPKSISDKRNSDQYINIPSQNVLGFKFPDPFDQKWMSLMESLAQINDNTLEFGLPKYGSNEKTVPFDFKLHHKIREQAASKLTSEIGWNLRKYPPEGILEYYWFHRFLKFEKFKILVRDSIVNTLNEGLSRINNKLGMQGKIVIKGLPTLDDVERAQDDLATGNRSGEEILKQFRGI